MAFLLINKYTGVHVYKKNRTMSGGLDAVCMLECMLGKIFACKGCFRRLFQDGTILVFDRV